MTVDILVETLFWWRHYSGGDIILVETLFGWRHYSGGDIILVETLFWWRHYSGGDIIRVETLFGWRHYSGGDIIPIESERVFVLASQNTVYLTEEANYTNVWFINYLIRNKTHNLLHLRRASLPITPRKRSMFLTSCNEFSMTFSMYMYSYQVI